MAASSRMRAGAPRRFHCAKAGQKANLIFKSHR